MINFFSKYIFLILFSLNSIADIPAGFPLPTDERVKYILYNPSEVYGLNFLSNRDAGIEFSLDESIISASFGSSYGWSVKVENSNVLLIKPSAQAGDTNLRISTITKSGKYRRYFFDIYHVRKITNKDHHGIIYWATFVYPQINPDVPSNVDNSRLKDQEIDISIDKTKDEKQVEDAVKLAKLNKATKNMDKVSVYNYDYSYATPFGSVEKSSIPSRAYDDSKNIFIEFDGVKIKENMLSLDVKAVGFDGLETPVGFQAGLNAIIVSSIQKGLTIRYLNKKKSKIEVICIFNEKYSK